MAKEMNIVRIIKFQRLFKLALKTLMSKQQRLLIKKESELIKIDSDSGLITKSKLENAEFLQRDKAVQSNSLEWNELMFDRGNRNL